MSIYSRKIAAMMETASAQSVATKPVSLMIEPLVIVFFSRVVTRTPIGFSPEPMPATSSRDLTRESKPGLCGPCPITAKASGCSSAICRLFSSQKSSTFVRRAEKSARLSRKASSFASSLRCQDLDLDQAQAFCGKTKNGDPRAVYLPPRVVASLANHPRGLDRDERLFRWTKSGELYLLGERFYAAAGVCHGGAPFHVLRHTYGAWMTRIGADLVAAGAWKSATAARVYQHFSFSEEAKKASNLPGSKRAPNVRK